MGETLPHLPFFTGDFTMKLYYLTEMNMLKLENMILKFIHNNHIQQTLTNGIIGKITAMMYNKKIDYYYPDTLATTLNVDIKHVDTVYLYGHADIYDKTLKTLLDECELYKGNLKEVQKLEVGINQILETKKPIRCKNIRRQKQ